MEEWTAVDVLLTQQLHQSLLAQRRFGIPNYCHHPIGILGIRSLVVELNVVDVGQIVRVPSENLALSLDQFFDSLQLGQAQGGLHTAHLVFEGNLRIAKHPVPRLASVIAKHEGALINIFAVGYQHSPLTSGQRLGSVKAIDTCVSETACLLSFVF